MVTQLDQVDTIRSADPIRANQHTFRMALDALALPGQVQHLRLHPQVGHDVPQSLRWPATLLLMLLDHEVSLSTTGFAAEEALIDFLKRRTRVDLFPADRAAFIVADSSTLTPDLFLSLRRGSLYYPDDSATLVVLVDDLQDATPLRTITGPGVEGSLVTALPGISDLVLEAREHVSRQYPKGIDMFLLDQQGCLLGLPRTTVIANGKVG